MKPYSTSLCDLSAYYERCRLLMIWRSGGRGPHVELTSRHTTQLAAHTTAQAHNHKKRAHLDSHEIGISLSLSLSLSLYATCERTHHKPPRCRLFDRITRSPQRFWFSLTNHAMPRGAPAQAPRHPAPTSSSHHSTQVTSHSRRMIRSRREGPQTPAWTHMHARQSRRQ